MNKYKNKTITCYVDDARIIRRLKKALCLKKSNDVIRVMTNHFLDILPLETRTNVLGTGYVVKCKKNVCK